MGCNYYAAAGDACEHCGRANEWRHIGKSSAGWCFSLHVYPDDDIRSLDDWRLAWHGRPIVDEYRRSVSEPEMLRIITERDARYALTAPPGYDDWEHFHRVNGSVAGPLGLVRHRVDGTHCVGHGDGTWDYLVGDFS